MKMKINWKKNGILMGILCLLLCFAWIYCTAKEETTEPRETAVPVIQWLNTAEAEASVEEIDAYDLYAKAAVLMDAGSGRVLYSKNGADILPMASTTKIMTCIVALEQGNLDDIVTASSYASTQPKVRLGVTKGNSYKMQDLLYSLMLESHNDAAVIIAEHIGARLVKVPVAEKRTAEESAQAVMAFAKLMNRKAEELGCENTFFVTPNGLDATGSIHTEGEIAKERSHSTTAEDLATIMRYCAFISEQKESFLEITRTSSYSFTDVAGKKSHSCVNHNSFLNMMDGALTGKTGFTNAAGYCYVGALTRDGKTFTVALLACGWPNNKSWKWADTKKLMSYGLENYVLKNLDELTPEEESLPQVKVENGQTQMIGQTAYTKVRIEGAYTEGAEGDKTEKLSKESNVLLRKDEEVRIVREMQEHIPAPVYVGEKIGSIQYVIDGKVYRMDDIVITEEVPRINFRWCFERVYMIFLL